MHPFDIQAFAGRIKALRLERGLTQKEVSEASDVSLYMLQRCENGKPFRNLESLIKLAHFYNTTTQYLLTGD